MITQRASNEAFEPSQTLPARKDTEVAGRFASPPRAAEVRIKHSFKSYLREIHAAQRFAHTTHPFAMNIRQQLMSGTPTGPTVARIIDNDLTGEFHHTFDYGVQLFPKKLAVL